MNRLAHEPLTAAHAVELSGALTDPRVYAHIAGNNPTTTAELAAQFARMAAGPSSFRGDQVWWNFAVRLTRGECIGRIQSTIHDRIAEVGYLFGPAYWGRGYATEAVSWLHEQLSDSGLVDSCWATVTPENTKSVRLLKRLGYEMVPEPWPSLLGYDAGDLVFHLTLRLEDGTDLIQLSHSPHQSAPPPPSPEWEKGFN